MSYKYIVARLRDCLKLQNNTACFNVLVGNISDIGRKHFDFATPASRQKDALVAIGEELKELYPDIFSDEDSDKRVTIAVKIAMHTHNTKRRYFKRKESEAGQLPPKKKVGNPASKSVSKKPHIRRSLSAPKQVSNKRDINQAPVDATKHTTDKTFGKRKKTPDIRPSPPASTQGYYQQDKDQAPMDVTTHSTEIVSDKVKNIPDSPSTPPQCVNEQDENRAPMDVTTDKASGKMKAEKIPGKRCSSLIPTQEQDKDQAPINVTMHTVDKSSDKKKAKMSLFERMALNLASIASTSPAPSMFATPSLRSHTSQPSGSVSSPFSQPRKRVLFVPHVSNSQPQLNNTPSRRWDTICSEHSSVSMCHPVAYSTSTDTSGNLSTSIGSSMHGGTLVLQSDKSTSVHHFLEACVPSMSYLLPQFIDYGCTHEGFLLAVSMWPPEKIRKFLEDVVTGPDGRLISPMEQMVLENHLTQYFKA